MGEIVQSMWRLAGHQQMDMKPPRRLVVSELHHVIRTRDGKNPTVLPAGRHRVNRRRDRITVLPATPTVVTVPGQEVLTADGVTVRATVSLVTEIVEPLAALRAGDWRERLYLDVQLALRTAIAARPLEDLIAGRGELDEPLLAAATESARSMGVAVSKLAVRDVVVPGEQRRLMAQIVEARLAGQAQLERARAESAALRNLANAASMLRDNPELFRLRVVQEMANSSGNTYVIDADPPPS